MKRILILGATSAIATACARVWAARGASLFLVARDAERLAAVAADLRTRGAAGLASATLDANALAAHAGVLDAAFGHWGDGEGIDLVLIAHGTLPDQRLVERDATRAVAEFATNATSVIALLTDVANRMAPRRHGAIGVITSVAGDRGRPSNYVYGSAKAAVSAFCEGLRARLFREGVTLTDIRPGFVASPMTQGLPLPAPLVAQPEAIAPRIVAAIERGRDVVYVPAFWRLVMFAVRNLPRAVFKRIRL
jgi:decaprenylphospho-beta-D-erythro-pentofuranosid-2-ulose 2-reductase